MQITLPGAAQRIAAAGPVAGLFETLGRALDPRDDFQPLAKPGPADWLANHAEPGQTLEQFLRVRPNRPDKYRRTLYLLPLGNSGQGDAPPLEELVRFTAAFFGMEAPGTAAA